MNSILSTLSNLFSAVAGWFGYARQRDAEKNAPDIKAAAIAKQSQEQTDEINKTVAKGDLEKERELGAE